MAAVIGKAGLQTLFEDSLCMSFRGAAGDEESLTALKIVARASRPRGRERPAPARGQDAHATAGGTPALRPSACRRRCVSGF